MDSFYGGKPGISFIIRDSFKSIQEMTYCFKHGYYPKKDDESEQWINDESKPYNNTVRYGEYCLIDTPNKNNIDNGKVYRRTAYRANESDELQYCEYIGQIVGPAGGVPQVELGSINTLQANFNHIPFDEGGIYYQTPTNGGYKYTSDIPSTTTPADALYINTVTNTVTNTTAIYKSGKQYYNTVATLNETPAFKYGFYTFQNNVEAEDDTELPNATLGIGFEIPYVDFATPVVNMQSFKDAPTVTATPLNDFYYQYTFNIPGGLPGGFFTNIKTTQVGEYMGVPTPSSTPTIYPVEAIKINPGSEVPYSIDTSVDTITAFSSPFILTGNFKYPVIGTGTATGGWITASESIYLGNVSTVQHMTVTYDNINKYYRLKIKYGDTEQDQYFDVGSVGPAALGPYAIKLTGQYDTASDAYFPYIDASTLTPTPDSTGQNGNLGVLSGDDVRTPEGFDPGENTVNKDAVYYYIYENGQWNYLGNQLSNNTTVYAIDTTLTDLSTKNSTVPVQLLGEPIPKNNDAIDDFGLILYTIPTASSSWSIPWK